MYKCLVLDVITPRTKALLARYLDTTEIEFINAEELKKIIGEYDAMLFRNRPTTAHDVVDCMIKMKVISLASAGTDSIDIAYANSKGITVHSVPGLMADSVAGIAVGMMAFLLHEAHRAVIDMKNGIWDRSRYEYRINCRVRRSESFHLGTSALRLHGYFLRWDAKF